MGASGSNAYHVYVAKKRFVKFLSCLNYNSIKFKTPSALRLIPVASGQHDFCHLCNRIPDLLQEVKLKATAAQFYYFTQNILYFVY